ncbi:hypothetical protein [Streptacidiphilus rugosus]|uniref:hypothetical protein n=1 Tax=Streptacidiphilus rugosus TaxID=405783 RepID=UPI00068B5A08|nr:hypothetical protein [Streptacidiphilus rugosus]
MVDTTPRGRADLPARHPGLADYARPALRLHPRRGAPGVGDSSVGGPLLWPVDEPWPTCADDHELDGGEPVSQEAALADMRRILRGQALEGGTDVGRLDPGVAAGLTCVLHGLDTLPVAPPASDPPRVIPAEPVVMASVLQLYRRDLPAGPLPLPEWMFPGGTDVLQVVWCPNPHEDTYEPRVRLYWRTEAELGSVRDADPDLNLFTRDEDVDFTPRPCVLHPESVEEHPPITLSEPGGDDFESAMLGILPPALERACAAWTADGEPRAEFDRQDYSDHAGVPGWKLGGWLPHLGFFPLPDDHCVCGAPTFLLLGATFEALVGPWLPTMDPGFPWTDPEEWDAGGPTGVWCGRNGRLWLLGCTADPAHPVLTYSE